MGKLLNFQPVYFIRVTIYPAAIPHHINRGLYLPYKGYYLVLACTKAIIHITLLCFFYDIANILYKSHSYASVQIFYYNKI